jgi:hypothetical protein
MAPWVPGITLAGFFEDCAPCRPRGRAGNLSPIGKAMPSPTIESPMKPPAPHARALDGAGRSPAGAHRRRASRGAALSDLLVGLGLTVVLAVVLVPRIAGYVQRSGSTEAIDALAQIFRGSAFYFATPQVAADGALLPCQFPRSQGITPVVFGCCPQGKGSNAAGGLDCAVPEDAWDEETWKALSFTAEGRSTYGYVYESGGLMKSARFEATAHGDTDCDGTVSTFRRVGVARPTTRPLECAMDGADAVEVISEH